MAKRQDLNPIKDARVNAVLAPLHAKADAQLPGLIAYYLGVAAKRLVGFSPPVGGAAHADIYRDKLIPIDKEQGWFIYQLVRGMGARRVVEYGTSHGVSTLYLAAALRDNGGEGVAIGTEIEPVKIAAAKRNFEAAGLAPWIDLREGDALETLRDCGGPVDFLLMDGWSELALPILRIVGPQLRRGATIVCDNVGHFPKAYADYTDFIRNPANGFSSTLLPLRSGTEFSVKL